MDVSCIRQSATFLAPPFPFEGLGHDLTSVRLRAYWLVPVPASVECHSTAAMYGTEPQRLAGFDLLLCLGCEIRGR